MVMVMHKPTKEPAIQNVERPATVFYHMSSKASNNQCKKKISLQKVYKQV